MLERLSPHLKDDGIMVLTVPSANKPVSAKHYQHFTPEGLSRTLEPYFEVVDVAGYGVVRNQKRLSMLKKIVAVVFPFRNRIKLVRRIVDYLPEYYEKEVASGRPEECAGLIAVCRKKIRGDKWIISPS